MRIYPNGAIKSVAELMRHKNKRLWAASVVFINNAESFVFNGLVSEEDINKFVEYKEGMKPIFIKTPGCLCGIVSLLDMNVIPNHYNDWYLFHNEYDAKHYLNRKNADE